MSYKKAVVSFLDILGTRENQEFASKHKIHRAFHESMQDCEKRDRSEVAYYRKVFSFSDCAYIFHGIRNKTPSTQAEKNHLVQSALLNTTLTTLRLLNEGYLIRGGISYGDTYHDDLSFFGPAVEEAYINESKKAITPKIFISDELGKEAKEFSDRVHKEAFSKENPNFKLLPERSYIPELIQKNGATYLLNPLYILEMDSTAKIGEHEFCHEELTTSLLKKIEAQIYRHPWESPARVKLEWMREYVANSRCSLINPKSSFAFTR